MRILFYLDVRRLCLVIPLSSSYSLLLIICLSEELDVNSPLLLQWRGAAQEFSRRFERKSSQGSGFRRSYVVIWILLFHSGLLQGNLLWLFSPLTSKKPVHSSRKQHLAPCLQPLAKTGSAFCPMSCDDYGPSTLLEGGWKRGGHMQRAEPTPVQGEGVGSSALCDVPKSSFSRVNKNMGQANRLKKRKEKDYHHRLFLGGPLTG